MQKESQVKAASLQDQDAPVSASENQGLRLIQGGGSAVDCSGPEAEVEVCGCPEQAGPTPPPCGPSLVEQEGENKPTAILGAQRSQDGCGDTA